MTIYRDDDGNLENDDFIPRVATDEDLIQPWKQAHKKLANQPVHGFDDAVMSELAILIVMCASQLGKRGYRLNADVTDWIKAAPDSQS